MITATPTAVRRRPRLLAGVLMIVAALLVVLTPGVLAGAASASPPQGWSDPDPVSGIRALVVFVFAPLATIAVVTLLAMLPRLAGTATATPALTEPATEDGIDALLGPSDGPAAIES